MKKIKPILSTNGTLVGTINHSGTIQVAGNAHGISSGPYGEFFEGQIDDCACGM